MNTTIIETFRANEEIINAYKIYIWADNLFDLERMRRKLEDCAKLNTNATGSGDVGICSNGFASFVSSMTSDLMFPYSSTDKPLPATE
jgi:hypothetical protein